MLAVGILGLAATLAGVWWFLAKRGVARWFAAALVIVALVTVLVFYISRGRLLDVVLAFLLGGVAGAAGRAALDVMSGQVVDPADGRGADGGVDPVVIVGVQPAG